MHKLSRVSGARLNRLETHLVHYLFRRASGTCLLKFLWNVDRNFQLQVGFEILQYNRSASKQIKDPLGF